MRMIDCESQESRHIWVVEMACVIMTSEKDA
jgi:hypothetical protein